MNITREQIERAAELLKILRLVNTPGMDMLAVRLNCAPTHDEIVQAVSWARAFEIASEPGDSFEQAVVLAGKLRR